MEPKFGGAMGVQPNLGCVNARRRFRNHFLIFYDDFVAQLPGGTAGM
jgi:hypothetical protein